MFNDIEPISDEEFNRMKITDEKFDQMTQELGQRSRRGITPRLHARRTPLFEDSLDDQKTFETMAQEVIAGEHDLSLLNSEELSTYQAIQHDVDELAARYDREHPYADAKTLIQEIKPLYARFVALFVEDKDASTEE